MAGSGQHGMRIDLCMRPNPQWRAGSVPLHTLRANIDYGFTEARTVYGKIGIKCWICLEDDEKALN